MNRLIIVGSPRSDGRSAALADLLFEACIDECPDDELALVPVSTLDISGCVGCDGCKGGAEGTALDGDDAVAIDAAEENAPCARCVIADDMAEVYPLIDDADELTVVSPVYFAGAPSQLKALLDRLQPYYWAGARFGEKRPAVLHVVGEGGDPHGFDPLVGTVRSALAVAGFRLETVFDWVGKIDPLGEIIADAEEYRVTDGASSEAAQLRGGEELGSHMAESGDPGAGESESVAQGALGGAEGNEPEPEVDRNRDRGVILGFDDARAASHAVASRGGARKKLSLGANGSERQVISLDENGERVDQAQYGRKKPDGKNASTKRGPGGSKSNPPSPHKGNKGRSSGRSGGAQRGGGQGRSGARGGSQKGKRRG